MPPWKNPYDIADGIAEPDMLISGQITGAGGLRKQGLGSLAINSTCTVFGESEVISLLSQGAPVGEIVAGLHNVVAKRIEGMVGTLRPRPGSNLLRSVVVCGGVALNRGVVRAIEKTLGVNVAVPQNPQTVGALGAALAASETYNTSGRGVAKGAE